MFREMRRKEKLLENNEIISILEKGNYGILSTIGESGYPYGVPMNYIYYNESIYLHCADEGYKLDNISKNNKVSFCIVRESEVVPEKFSTNYKSVITFGKIKIVDDNEKKEVLLNFIKKFAKDFLDKGIKYVENSFHKTTVLEIKIEHLTGKGSK
ncbi:pyridoxamine 5'-phosphate oxidase family protein [Clostridium sp. D2Q-14]|uniref:pyridoxamine 5'-phosphate oxidase family protein n=1 Tax=Anaeromonas gelatinilytica TaxID=2683194 RepID=UPI00193B70F9|nr:pyridoxamine 5'-phosphate oxidase family protein [Anaeromonas gelatinilytica]MBS4535742.1 pyridoxamine 5'-phosphate oxidase family protein [Anaeromonas gelatinilytica]